MSHIIRKLTITETSLKLEFSNDDNDPFIHVATLSALKVREEIIQSHIEAIAERVIGDKEEKYAEDKKQGDLFTDGDEPKTHKAGEDPTDFSADPGGEAESMNDWSDVAVPLLEGTQMPHFKKMTTDHAHWYVNNHYTGEDGEPGTNDLIQDFKHSMDMEIENGWSLNDTKEAAIKNLEF